MMAIRVKAKRGTVYFCFQGNIATVLFLSVWKLNQKERRSLVDLVTFGWCCHRAPYLNIESNNELEATKGSFETDSHAEVTILQQGRCQVFGGPRQRGKRVGGPRYEASKSGRRVGVAFTEYFVSKASRSGRRVRVAFIEYFVSKASKSGRRADPKTETENIDTGY
ncbi:hypothetical protein Btru_056248 [Bulinus truncatus]|nr:hypothetical protein Btru_056248 [Bulinus truncatus]